MVVPRRSAATDAPSSQRLNRNHQPVDVLELPTSRMSAAGNVRRISLRRAANSERTSRNPGSLASHSPGENRCSPNYRDQTLRPLPELAVRTVSIHVSVFANLLYAERVDRLRRPNERSCAHLTNEL